MGLYDHRRHWIISYYCLDCILLSAGLYRIVGWIVLYQLDWIVSYRLDLIVSYWLDWIILYRIDWIVSYRLYWIVLYRIVLAESGNIGFSALAGYCLDGMDGTDGLDGALVGRGWDGRMLAPAGRRAPPWAPEKERHCWLLRGGDALDGYCHHGTDETDEMDGALVPWFCSVL